MQVVAFPGPGAGGNFLEQILGDLLQVMGGPSAGGARIDLARTLAQAVASGGEPERNVEPADRMKFEELARIAELHVAELTGLPLTATGATIDITAVSPGAWAVQTVEDWRFLLEAMTEPAEPKAGKTGTAGTPGPGSGEAPGRGKGPLGYVDTARSGDMPADFEPGFDSGFDPDIEPSEQGPADLLARYMATMGPMLAAMQLGSAIGHLARSTMGAYDLPIPRPGPRLLVVPANVTRFAEDWSLTPDEVRLWVCLRELTAHAVLSRPHVAQRLQELLVRVVLGMAEDTSGLVDQLQGFDLTQPESLQNLLADPTGLMSLEQSPARRRAAEDLSAVMTALLGYVEHILDLAATRLLGGAGPSPRHGAVGRSIVRARRAPPSSCSAWTSDRLRSTGATPSCAASSSGPATPGWPGCGRAGTPCRHRPRSTRRACGWNASTCPIPTPARRVEPTALNPGALNPERDGGAGRRSGGGGHLGGVVGFGDRGGLLVGEAEVPFELEVLALGVPHDAFAVAPELGVVGGQQGQAGERAVPEGVDDRRLAVGGLHLPVRRHRAQVHDAHVATRRLRFLDFLDLLGHRASSLSAFTLTGDGSGPARRMRGGKRHPHTHPRDVPTGPPVVPAP